MILSCLLAMGFTSIVAAGDACQPGAPSPQFQLTTGAHSIFYRTRGLARILQKEFAVTLDKGFKEALGVGSCITGAGFVWDQKPYVLASVYDPYNYRHFLIHLEYSLNPTSILPQSTTIIPLSTYYRYVGAIPRSPYGYTINITKEPRPEWYCYALTIYQLTALNTCIMQKKTEEALFSAIQKLTAVQTFKFYRQCDAGMKVPRPIHPCAISKDGRAILITTALESLGSLSSDYYHRFPHAELLVKKNQTLDFYTVPTGIPREGVILSEEGEIADILQTENSVRIFIPTKTAGSWLTRTYRIPIPFSKVHGAFTTLIDHGGEAQWEFLHRPPRSSLQTSKLLEGVMFTTTEKITSCPSDNRPCIECCSQANEQGSIDYFLYPQHKEHFLFSHPVDSDALQMAELKRQSAEALHKQLDTMLNTSLTRADLTKARDILELLQVKLLEKAKEEGEAVAKAIILEENQSIQRQKASLVEQEVKTLHCIHTEAEKSFGRLKELHAKLADPVSSSTFNFHTPFQRFHYFLYGGSIPTSGECRSKFIRLGCKVAAATAVTATIATYFWRKYRAPLAS